MKEEDIKIEFEFDRKAHPIKKLWDEMKFRLVLLWYIIKGFIVYYGSMGSVEIEVGYEENGKMHYYLQLEKLW